jgi:hypothetical protein
LRGCKLSRICVGEKHGAKSGRLSDERLAFQPAFKLFDLQ